MENELEYLQKIKKQLLDACIDMPGIGRDTHGNQINILHINSDAWHDIFKTDEYNKLKEDGKATSKPG